MQDNDQSLSPSPGDFFSIKLFDRYVYESTDLSCSHPIGTVFYTRAGC